MGGNFLETPFLLLFQEIIQNSNLKVLNKRTDLKTSNLK